MLELFYFWALEREKIDLPINLSRSWQRHLIWMADKQGICFVVVAVWDYLKRYSHSSVTEMKRMGNIFFSEPTTGSREVLGKADAISLNAPWWWDAVQGCVESHLMTSKLLINFEWTGLRKRGGELWLLWLLPKIAVFKSVHPDPGQGWDGMRAQSRACGKWRINTQEVCNPTKEWRWREV